MSTRGKTEKAEKEIYVHNGNGVIIKFMENAYDEALLKDSKPFHIFINTLMHPQVCIYIYIVCVYMCISVYICVCMCVCARI